MSEPARFICWCGMTSPHKNGHSKGLGWHVMSGEHLLEMLRSVAEGEDPDVVYAQEYANADREQIDGR